MHNQKLQKLFMILLVCIIPVCAVTMQVFALVNQSIVRKYPLTIKAENIVFLYNDKTYLDEISTQDIDLYKGEPTDITMTVKVIGPWKVAVDYSISFELVNPLSTPDDPLPVSDITEAIEVYCYKEGKYEFLCMLNDLESRTIDGFMVTNLNQSIDLRLVYSSTASKYYDDIASGSNVLDDGKFIVRATNSASINTTSDSYIFVEDYADFKASFIAPSSVGKIIVLSDDITVTESLTSTGKVGIDIGGSTLTMMNGVTLTVNCNYDAGLSANRLGITNGDSVTGGLVALGSGKINVINTSQCYLIDKSILTQHSAAFGITANTVFNDFVALIKERSASLTDGRLFYDGADVSFLFDNLEYYLARTPYSVTTESDSAIQYNPVTGKASVALGNELTDKFLFGIRFTSGTSIIVSGYVTVRGNSPKAIADALIAELPVLIKESQYLKSYDAPTASYIEWYIDDGLKANLLDDYGRYKKNGLDALLARLIDSENFSDRSVDVYVKVTKGAETGEPSTGENWFLYTVKAEALNAAERTTLIYNSVPITLTAETGALYDIYDLYLLKDYKDLLAGGSPNLAALVNLIGITITIVDDPKDFIEVVNIGGSYASFNALKIKDTADISKNTLFSATISITFTYSGGGAAPNKSYTLNKEIIISGGLAEITRYDMGYRLQSALVANPYLDGDAWWFYGYGALMPRTSGRPVTVFVEYEVQGDAAEYISVTYDYVLVPYAELEEGITYFVSNGLGGYAVAEKQNGLGQYDPDGEYPSAGTYYERKANIEILPDRIPHVEPKTVFIEARLYTLDEFGNPHMVDAGGNLITSGTGEKVYVDPVTNRVQELTYELTLAVDGVIRNRPDQIADANLFYIFRQLFDANEDGIITYSEAQDWTGLIARYEASAPTSVLRSYMKLHTSYTTSSVYYIDLVNQSITGLKGLEYFLQVTGYNFSGTGISDISVLSGLHNLVYLSFQNDFLASLAPLAYMNKLQCLDFTNNSIINLEPLRYLPALRYLNLQNNSVVNFEPLTELTTLRWLIITGMNTNYGANFTTDPITMYDFALIKVNNPSIAFTYGTTINITTAMQVATAVMRDVEEINRARHTLYLPAFYYYYDTYSSMIRKYQLYWYTDVTETNLSITYDGAGNVNYTILQPVYDKPVRLYLKVYIPDSGTATFDMSREFRLTLETASSTGLYVYNGSTYVDAYTYIPDDNLRNLIFDTFNHYTAGNVSGYPEANTISAADLTYFTNNRQLAFNWSNLGIADLTGIGILRDIFVSSPVVTLNLTGNPFTSLTPLKDLPSLHTLTVGGNEYDFNELIKPSSSLRSLNAVECLNLESEQSLASLYALYCSNGQLNISIKSGYTWDPFALLMPKKVQNFPTTAAFSSRGDTFDLYEGKGNFPVMLYGKQYNFTVSSATIYAKSSTSSTTQFFSVSGGTLTYGIPQMYASSDSSYAVMSIQSTQNISDQRAQRIGYSNGYRFQMIVNDAAERIYVHNVAGGINGAPGLPGASDGRFDVMTLAQLVGSRDLRSAALTRISIYTDTNYNVAGRRVPYNSSATMANIRSYLTPAVGATSLYGSTGITDTGGYNSSGTYVQYASSTGVGGRRHYAYFYYDEATKCYHITTDLLRYTSVTGNSAMTGAVGPFVGSYLIYMYGTYESGDNMLNGLRYFTGITTLYMYGDAKLGDGAELVNITTLMAYYSSVDLTTITTHLTNLTSLTVNSFYAFDAGDEANSALRFMPNLTTLSIINAQTRTTPTTAVRMSYLKDYSFLMGLIRTGNLSNLSSLTLTGMLNSTVVSTQNAEYVRDVWLAAVNNGRSPAYQIGTPQASGGSGYFRLIGGVMWLCTNNTDATQSLSWDVAAATTQMNITDVENYNYVMGYSGNTPMRDMGLKINTSASNVGYWANTRANSVSGVTGETLRGFGLVGSDNLTLPASTGEDYYGLKFGSTQPTVRSYNISWTYWFVSNSGNAYTGTAATGSDTVSSRFGAYGGYGATAGYLVLIGAITNNPAGTTPYAYFYHFVVGAGDGYYSTVTDRTLRAWLFATEYGPSAGRVSDAININTHYTYGVTNFLSIMGRPAVLPGDTFSTTYIYSLEGIGNVVRQWEISRNVTQNSIRNAITTVEIVNQYFTDISPLFVFENVVTLRLNGSGTSYISRASLDGIDSVGTIYGVKGSMNTYPTVFRNLEALNLRYNYNNDPDDIYNLLKVKRNLKSLNFYYTNCMNNRNIVEYLQTYMAAFGVSSLNLEFNQNSTDATTKSVIDNFLSETDTSNSTNPYYTGTGITSTSNIYTSRTETRTIGGRNYTFAMRAEVNTLIKNYNVCNAVPLKLEVYGMTAVGYRQFNNTYINTVFKRNDVTAPFLFGYSSLPLVGVAANGYTPLVDANGYPTQVNFDTELIAYLMLTAGTTAGRLTLNSGSYRAVNTAANVTLPATNYGIALLTNANTLLSGSYVFSFNTTPTHVLALAYRHLNYTFAGPTAVNAGGFANPSMFLGYLGYILGTNNSNRNYNYTGNNQPTYIADLPTHIYYLGTQYPLVWSIGTVSANISLYNSGPTTPAPGWPPSPILSGGGTVAQRFTLSPSTIRILAASGSGSFRLNVSATNPSAVSPAPTGNIFNGTNNYITINVNKYDAGTSATVDYDFFIEVASNEISNQSGGSCNVTFKDDVTGAAYYSVTNVPYTTLYLYNSRYYTQYVSGSSSVYAVEANSVFESPNMAQYIYTRYYANTTNNIVLDGVGGTQAGYIMTQDNISAMQTFNLEYGGTSTSYNQYYTQYVSSIEGIQLFYKMTSFIAKGGLITDIAPLANFHLTNFEYCNSYQTSTTVSYDGMHYNITDFSPLLQGSKNSLLSFYYNGGNVMMTDMNFLLAFTALQDVYLGYAHTTYFSTSYGTQGLRYFLTPSGKYLLTALWNRGVYVYAEQSRINSIGLVFDSSKSKQITSYTLYTYSVYAIRPSTEDLIAYEVLSQFRSDMSNIGYLDGYKMNVTGGYTPGNTVALDITATLAHNGQTYLIDWRKAGASITVGGYYLQNSITVGGTTYAAGLVTQAQAQLITDSVAFYEAYKSGTNKLTTRITVETAALSPAGIGGLDSMDDIIDLRLICRVYHNEYAIERMFTISF